MCGFIHRHLHLYCDLWVKKKIKRERHEFMAELLSAYFFHVIYKSSLATNTMRKGLIVASASQHWWINAAAWVEEIRKTNPLCGYHTTHIPPHNQHFCSLEIHCLRLSVTDDKAYQPGSAHPKSFTILKLILHPFGGQKCKGMPNVRFPSKGCLTRDLWSGKQTKHCFDMVRKLVQPGVSQTLLEMAY